MTANPFHLGWFYSKGFGPKAWKHPWAGSAVAKFTKPDMGVDLARSMERAGFDYIMIEDSSNVPYTYQGSHDAYLRQSVDTPKLDPTVLAAYMIQATSRLGVVVTCSTTEYHPFMLARKMNALDHVSDGRIGWNVVTGSNDGGAQNYGRPKQYPHDQRYDMADEFMEIANGLWRSWDADALVLDLEKGIFADGQKVHPINYEGQYYSSRGPLSSPMSPQVSPVICQAGGSGRGRTFAARWSETIISAESDSPEKMKAFRDDIRARAVADGRDPDSIKVLFLVSPIVDETMSAAQDRLAKSMVLDANALEYGLASMSRGSGVDFSQFPLDEPLPEIKSNGHQSSAAKMKGQVLRDLLVKHQMNWTVPEYVGTVDHVAGYMDEVMAYVGGDGFLLVESYFSRRYATEICDGLVPELQKRGLTRKAYEHELFRDNLMAF